MLRLTLTLFLVATPVWAEDKPNLDPTAAAIPGAVALYLSATSLYDLGVAAKDPLMVLTAAKMLRGITMIPADRSPDPAPKTVTALIQPDSTGLIAAARAIGNDEAMTDLINSTAAETPPPPKSLRATAAHLDPGQSQVWTLQFYGGSYAEVAIAGLGKGNLDLLVADANGNLICADHGNANTAYCGFVPKNNADFTVTVINPGAVVDAYMLLTN
jgi:hypothetical protein